jgi:hypothetical protein
MWYSRKIRALLVSWQNRVPTALDFVTRLITTQIILVNLIRSLFSMTVDLNYLSFKICRLSVIKLADSNRPDSRRIRLASQLQHSFPRAEISRFRAVGCDITSLSTLGYATKLKLLFILFMTHRTEVKTRDRGVSKVNGQISAYNTNTLFLDKVTHFPYRSWLKSALLINQQCI